MLRPLRRRATAYGAAAPAAVLAHIDDIGSWPADGPTVSWNAPLARVSAFIAGDLG